MLKLKETNDGSIKVKYMKDGQIAVITSWSSDSGIGKIVQRYGLDLVSLGEAADLSWGNAFGSIILSDNCRVRILKSGEILVVGE